VQGVQENTARLAQPRPYYIMHKSNLPLFRLGDIYITPGAQAALTAHAVTPATLLDRHVTGDWSNLSLDDIKANRDAVADGARVFSSYHIAPKVRVWIITEASRASSTILLPEDY
jgi:hypothetical protein